MRTLLHVCMHKCTPFHGHEQVDELKEELEARDEAKTGNKSWLRRRLHAEIMREYTWSANFI